MTHCVLFEFSVILFDIKNSPSEYQRAIDVVFGDLYQKGVLCFVDDIVIFSQRLFQVSQSAY